jgi:integrase
MAGYRQRGKKWQYRIKHNGEEISKSGFATKAEAKAAADIVEYELQMGINHNKGDMLFPHYYEQWINAYKLGAYSESTDDGYREALTLVEKYFGSTKLKNMTRLDYQNFLNDYAENGARGKKKIAKSTVKKTHMRIAASLRDAHEEGLIKTDVTKKVTFKGKDSQEEGEKYLNLNESEKLLDTLLNGLNNSMTTRYMVILQLATGMRIGEVMGLQFKDLDFLRNRVNVSKKWDYKHTNDFAPTKGRESRNISVDGSTMKVIRKFYDHQMNQKIKDSKERLFAVRGKVPSVEGVNGMLTRACKRIGIERVTSHAMRHTHASLLILQGNDIAYISERLGHKDITVTLETYAHVLKELRAKGEQESLAVMENLYKESQP